MRCSAGSTWRRNGRRRSRTASVRNVPATRPAEIQRGRIDAEARGLSRSAGDSFPRRSTSRDIMPDRDTLTSFLEWVPRIGPWGAVLFAAVYVPAAVLFVPASVLTLGAGFVFGLAKGSA